MGQKVNPIANRLGYIKGWESNWYASSADFSDKLIEDETIRTYLRARINKGGISKIVIERTLKRITIFIHTAFPGIVIGRSGKEVDMIKEELKRKTEKDVQINIVEIDKPDLDAALVAKNIAKQLEARVNYRRAIRMAIKNTMLQQGEGVKVEGIKVRISGRIGGAEMARREEFKEGKTPLHTFRSDIDYSLQEAQTVYGKIGIKVWICKGEVYGRPELVPDSSEPKDKKRTPNNQYPNANRNNNERNNRGGGDRQNQNNRNRRQNQNNTEKGS